MLFLFSILFAFSIGHGDFRNIFNNDYSKAEKFLSSKNEYFDSFAELLDTDKRIVCSVVFPEAIRYSMIRNYLETGSLELVYVNTGVVDFSIGSFQMKPSFVTSLEFYADSLGLYSSVPSEFRPVSDQLALYQQRKEVLNRLKSTEFQVFYSNLFYKVIETVFPDVVYWKIEDQVRFFSSAYNHDFTTSMEEILAFSKKSFFPWGSLNSKEKFNYTDISWQFYRENYLNE